MKFEHVAFNVPDSRAHARWLADALGFTIARAPDGPTHMHFLADETGRVVLELYTNPDQPMLGFKTQHPMVTHFALATADAGPDRARLEKAGAALFSDEVLPDGTRLMMLRDPWGFAIQFCQRTKPFPMP